MFAANDASLGDRLQLPAITDDDIAARAHQLWVERGCPHGDPSTDWFTARSQLASERTLRGAMTTDAVHHQHAFGRTHNQDQAAPPSSRRRHA